MRVRALTVITFTVAALADPGARLWATIVPTGDMLFRTTSGLANLVVTGGFFGIVTHLSMFATAAWFLLKQWWPNRGDVFPLAGLALLVAYFVNLCTLFDQIISYQCFAIFLALLATWEVQSGRRAPQTPSRSGRSTR